MKPKIMLIHPSFYVYGGAERQIAYMCNWLTDHNYQVTIFTTQMIPEMKKALKDTRYICIPDKNAMVSFTRKMMHKFDIINPHNHPAEMFSIPIKMPVVWQHNEPPTPILAGGKLNTLEKRMLQKYITKTVVISDFEKKRHKEVYGTDAIVNYPGVKYDYFNDKDYPTNPYDICGHKIDEMTKVILAPGYLVWTKNQLKSVEVFNEIKKKYPKSVLVLAGHDKDPYSQQVKAKIEALGLTDDVIITGYLEGDYQIRDLYYKADLCLFPLANQGGWASVFESIVCHTPTIVSEDFVGSNLVEEHALGVVSSLEDFTENALRVLERPFDVDTTWIKDNLTWDKFSERYDKIFMELYNNER